MNKAQDRMDKELEQVEAVPAPDPEPQVVIPPIADLYNHIHNTILPSLVGSDINKADKQQYRLKAADIALSLTALVVQR